MRWMFSAGRRSPFGILLLIPVGLLFGLVGFVMLLSNLSLIMNGVRTAGTIADIKTEVTHRDAYTDSGGKFHPAEDRTMHRAIVGFKTADGKDAAYTSSLGSSVPPTVGAVRAVLYDPKDPSRAADDSAATLWVIPVVLMLLGLGAVVGGVFILIILKKAAKAMTADLDRPAPAAAPQSSFVAAKTPATPPLAPDLVHYVRSALSGGHDKAAIRRTLIETGWPAEDVDRALQG